MNDLPDLSWPTPPPAPDPQTPDEWRTVVLRRRRGVPRLSPELWFGLIVLALFGVVALAALVHFGPQVDTLPVEQQWTTTDIPPGPSNDHPFGVMKGVGVGVGIALVEATPWDLGIVGGILVAAAALGLLLGAIAGLRESGALDTAITTWADSVTGVPPFFLVVLLFLGVDQFYGEQYWLLEFGLIFVFVLWPYYARVVRAKARQVAQEPFIEAARASGARSPRLLFRHVIPNCYPPLLAQIPVDVGNVFFVLTAFPFVACLNPGAFPLISPLPTVGNTHFPEWGSLLALGTCNGYSVLPNLNFWWMYIFPALTILAFGLGVAFTSDGLLHRLLPRRAV